MLFFETQCNSVIIPTQIDFLEDHILAPSGCFALKFLHALENDQVLLAHIPLGTEVLLEFFFTMGAKNWLILQQMLTCNFGGSWSNPTKLCHMMCHYIGMILHLTLPYFRGGHVSSAEAISVQPIAQPQM